MFEWVSDIELISEHEFQDVFRIGKEIMLMIAEGMAGVFDPFVHKYHIPLQLCVLIPIKYFASALSYVDMAIFFSVSKTKCHKLVDAFLVHFPRLFKADWVVFPSSEELPGMAAEFMKIKGVPNVVGGVDGTHIPVRGMENHRTEYYNRKSHYSVQLQVTCDARGVIWDYMVGYPGAVHDHRVFIKSKLYERLEKGDLGDYQLLGDAAYPLRPYCLTPLHAPSKRLFKGWEQLFNYVQSATRMPVERCIGALKGRWRLFGRRHECRLGRVCAGVGCIIILHNMITKMMHHHLRSKKKDKGRRHGSGSNGWWMRGVMARFQWPILQRATAKDLQKRRRYFGKCLRKAYLRRHHLPPIAP
ncbi:unnamed protein product [Closterium sp. NIES-54]